MENKYCIDMVYICPFVFLSGINIRPDLSYPARLCVINKEEGYAIDIETSLKYDYLESPSRLYIKSMIDKIKDNRRVAIPTYLCMNNLEYGYQKGDKIIKQLNLGKKFVNGNEILSNDEYLEKVNQISKSQVKSKIFKKRGK